jgi:hypothetical protein
VIVGVSPSASVAVAEQVKVELVVTPELGETVGPEMTGAVLSTLTLSVSESLSPEPSVAVAVQVMESLGEAVALLNVTLEPVPIVLEPLVQA